MRARCRWRSAPPAAAGVMVPRSRDVPDLAALRAAPIRVGVGDFCRRDDRRRLAGRTDHRSRAGVYWCSGNRIRICHRPPGTCFGEGWWPRGPQGSIKRTATSIYRLGDWRGENHPPSRSGSGSHLLRCGRVVRRSDARRPRAVRPAPCSPPGSRRRRGLSRGAADGASRSQSWLSGSYSSSRVSLIGSAGA